MDKLKESLSKITAWAKEHPIIAALILGGVILLAWYVSKSAGSGGGGSQMGEDAPVDMGSLSSLVGSAGSGEGVGVVPPTPVSRSGAESSPASSTPAPLYETPSLELEGLQDTGLFDMGALPFPTESIDAPASFMGEGAIFPTESFSNSASTNNVIRPGMGRPAKQPKKKQQVSTPQNLAAGGSNVLLGLVSFNPVTIASGVSSLTQALIPKTQPGAKGGKAGSPSKRPARRSNTTTTTTPPSPTSLYGWFKNSAGQTVWVLRSTAIRQGWTPAGASTPVQSRPLSVR